MFVRNYYGTRQLPFRTLRQALDIQRLSLREVTGRVPYGDDVDIVQILSVPELKSFLDRPLTRDEMLKLVSKKLDTAVLEIVCGRVPGGISARTAYRYKPSVQ